MKWLLSLVLVLLAVGTLRVSGCGGDECGGCDDGDPCTHDRCDSYRVGEPPGMCEPDEREIRYRCEYPQKADGTSCGGSNVCVGGQCTENLCANCEDDGNDCTHCDYGTGECNVPVPDETRCEGISHTGKCMSGVCIVCEELDCDDGNPCTEDRCHVEMGGCYHDPATCYGDSNRCTADMCDPEVGCIYPTEPADGHWCYPTNFTGYTGTCEDGACTGLPCDLPITEPYPCPVAREPHLSHPVCCPWAPDEWKGHCIDPELCEEWRDDFGAFEVQP